MMTLQDYRDQVRSDAERVMREEIEYWDTFDECMDSLIVDDGVTGNGSGSYTFSTWQAEQNVAGIIWDEDFHEMLSELGYEGVPVDKGPEALDVIARCLVLYEMECELEQVFEDLKEDEGQR